METLLISSNEEIRNKKLKLNIKVLGEYYLQISPVDYPQIILTAFDQEDAKYFEECNYTLEEFIGDALHGIQQGISHSLTICGYEVKAILTLS